MIQAGQTKNGHVSYKVFLTVIFTLLGGLLTAAGLARGIYVNEQDQLMCVERERWETHYREEAARDMTLEQRLTRIEHKIDILTDRVPK